jgi:hypothetical protein
MMQEYDDGVFLARTLAAIDQLLAEAESLAELPEASKYRDTVLDTLIEFQEIKGSVEAELRGK